MSDADPLVAFAPREREAALRGLVPPGVRLIPQEGADLGARLDRVLTDLLAEGYAGAVAIGADSPTLPTAPARTAVTISSGAARRRPPSSGTCRGARQR